MKQWNRMRGLPVIDQTSGKNIGKVEHVWLHAGGQEMQGITMKSRGFRARKLYASMADIRMLGDVSLIVSAVRAYPDDDQALRLGREIRVLNIDGEKIGWLTDALIDEETGQVAALEISRGYIDDIRRGREWVYEFTVRPCGVIAVMRAPGQGSGTRD